MRKNKLTKTSYQCVYETIGNDSIKNYIVRFSYLGRNYGERNFTKLFGARTAKQAFEKLQEVKTELSKGNNPFKKKKGRSVNEYFETFIKTQSNGNSKYGTRYRYENAYNKFIKETIGTKNIGDVTADDIQYILDVVMDKNTDRTKAEVKTTLKPLIKLAQRDGEVKYSVLEDIKFSKKRKKEELTYRVRTDLEIVANRLYKAILALDDTELKVIYLIALMCARRKGEILKLDYSYISGNKVYAPRSITKTSVTDEYPLPIEVMNLLPSLDTYKEGKLFMCPVHTPSAKFPSFIKDIDIEFSENQTFTLHDTRALWSSIMSIKTQKTDLVDRCISHTQAGSKGHYQSFGYNSRKELFEQYWDIVRGK